MSHQAPNVRSGDRDRFLATAAGAGLEGAAVAAATAVSPAGPEPTRRPHAVVDVYASFIAEDPHVQAA